MEGDGFWTEVFLNEEISIHSLRMEGDNFHTPDRLIENNFNPLPPHGGRHFSSAPCAPPQAFQSTPSAWRETPGISFILFTMLSFQSTPSAWRETIPYLQDFQILGNFNPLPPHGGRPASFSSAFAPISHFNPLPPHGGRLSGV